MEETCLYCQSSTGHIMIERHILSPIVFSKRPVEEAINPVRGTHSCLGIARTYHTLPNAADNTCSQSATAMILLYLHIRTSRNKDVLHIVDIRQHQDHMYRYRPGLCQAGRVEEKSE